MNMALLIPIALVVLVLLMIAYRRKGRGGSGLGDRSDATERPELRGNAQWRNRTQP